MDIFNSVLLADSALKVEKALGTVNKPIFCTKY